MVSVKHGLEGPEKDLDFEKAIDRLVNVARRGHRPGSDYNNPSDEWLISKMRIFQNMESPEQMQILEQVGALEKEAEQLNAQGRAATKLWPDASIQLDNGGLAFFSQLGVARRPDLTQYFIDGFTRNRDALAFDEVNQGVFTPVINRIVEVLETHLEQGDYIVQTDRQIGDAAGSTFHARQLLFGTHYLHLPYMWRQLTFDPSETYATSDPDILEISLPDWLTDLGLDDDLKSQIDAVGLNQLILKAPTKGLSLHLGFDYAGEHKMGPLSVAMFKAKQEGDIAVQAALSIARAKTIEGKMNNTAMITVGPSLHGKSTLTMMIEFKNSGFARIAKLTEDPDEGVYPMNDDIILLQRLPEPVRTSIGGKEVNISHGIHGTENNFYAVPFGLSRDDDPITYDVLRGDPDKPNANEILENVPVDHISGKPNYLENPVKNMRMILSRERLLARKSVDGLLGRITDGAAKAAVHIPMEHTNRIYWQAVMRQNTVIPPLRKLNLSQYIRVLMYGEAVNMGATAGGVIGAPYVEYFSDPFIIGLEDHNANNLYRILKEMADGGQEQGYFAFNTGGVGADTNDEAAGSNYKKISREVTLMLQEALVRGAVKFEYDPILGSEVAVAVVDQSGSEIVDLRQDWLPRYIYGEDEYRRRVNELKVRRYYGKNSEDKAGILRYTKVANHIYDLDDIPLPSDERQLSWLLSFYMGIDAPQDNVQNVVAARLQGGDLTDEIRSELAIVITKAIESDLRSAEGWIGELQSLGVNLQ